VSLADDDPVIFLILLDILHHHIKKVPLLISLERLTGIIILVEKYQMQESVEMFSDMRIDGLEGRNGDEPESLATDVLSWLYVSWVFQKEKPSRHITKILQLEGDAGMGETELQKLPILDRIICKWAHSQGSLLLKLTVSSRTPRASKKIALSVF
jgi:hypothetical protein